MIKDLIIQDEFFADPNKVLELAKKQTYFAPGDKNNWKGMRSEQLDKILNEEEMQLVYAPIVDLFHKTLKGSAEYKFNFSAKLFFHWLDENVKHETSFFHQDPNIMAGVVYLAKNPQPNSGTVVLKDEEKIEVENVFNRCALYNSNYFHSALNGFGKTVEDARLVLTIFFDEIFIAKHP